MPNLCDHQYKSEQRLDYRTREPKEHSVDEFGREPHFVRFAVVERFTKSLIIPVELFMRRGRHSDTCALNY